MSDSAIASFSVLYHAWRSAKLLAWMQQYSLQHISADAKQAIRGLVASYWGHFNHANSWRLTQTLLQQFPWLHALFVFSPKHAPVSRFACGVQHFMSEQVAFFQRMYPHCQIMLQRGYQSLCVANPAQPFARIWVSECGVLAHGLKRREVFRIEFLQPPRSFYETLSQHRYCSQ